MRKVMMLAAMLAMVLVAAAPAFAQSSAVGGDVQIQDQYCPQVIDQFADADQTNEGDDNIGSAVAQDLGISQEAVNACLQAGGDINAGGDGGTDTVIVVDENGDGVEVVEGVEVADTNGDGVITVSEAEAAGVASAAAAAAASAAAGGAAAGGAAAGAAAPAGGAAPAAGAAAPAAGTAAAASGGVLPDTGGASLIALGAGALLVGGGLLARRIIR